MNVCIIKNNKYDSLINKVLYYAFFVHQFFFLFSVSALARDIIIVRKYANACIIISFFVMTLTSFYYFLRGKFSIKEIIIYFVIAIPLLISLYNYRVVMVISNLFYAAIFKNVDKKKSLKVVLFATILGFIFNVLISIFTKYTGDCTQIRYGVPRVRHGLGFYFAYITSYYYLSIVLMYILAFDIFKWYEYFLLMFFNIVVFIYSDTKAAFTYSTFALILHLLFINRKYNFLNKIFDFLVICSFPIATFLAIFLPIFWTPGVQFWDKLNHLVNGRLHLTHVAFDVCGWKLFGQGISVWGNGEYYIDSAIASMLVQNGLIVLIMSVVFMTLYSYMAVKTKNTKLMIVLSIIALRSIFDLGFMTMQLAPVIILFYEVLNRFLNTNKS